MVFAAPKITYTIKHSAIRGGECERTSRVESQPSRKVLRCPRHSSTLLYLPGTMHDRRNLGQNKICFCAWGFFCRDPLLQPNKHICSSSGKVKKPFCCWQQRVDMANLSSAVSNFEMLHFYPTPSLLALPSFPCSFLSLLTCSFSFCFSSCSFYFFRFSLWLFDSLTNLLLLSSL